LRHESFLFSLQFSATLINLAQKGKKISENLAHKVNLPKMGKCFTTIVGQSDWSRHCYWVSCLTYGQSRRHREDLVTQTMHQDPKLKYENYKLVEFCQFVQCQGINRDTTNSH